MAISLPQYKQQAQPVADTTALKRDPNLEAKAILAEGKADAAVLEGFANVAKVGGQLALQYRDTHNKTELSNYSIEQKVMEQAYKDEISIITDEDKLARATEQYNIQVEATRQKYEDNIYGNKAKKQLGALDNDFKSRMNILSTNRGFNIEVDKLANSMFEYRTSAENGIILDNPETGQRFEPVYQTQIDPETKEVVNVLDENGQPIIERTAAQVQDEYATNELLRLNKITPQSAAQRKSQFGQNIEYKKIRNIINFDIDNFLKEYDPTKLSTEQNVSIQGLLKQAENEINTKTQRVQTKTQREAAAKVITGTIDIPTIIELANTTININGREIPILSEEDSYLLQTEITNTVKLSQTTENTKFIEIQKLIRELDPENFSMAKVNKIYSKMFEVKNKQPQALFPIQQIRLWRNSIQEKISDNDVTIDFANGAIFTGKDMKLTPAQKDVFNEIFDISIDMLQLENNPLARLNTTLGTAIKRTQEAQSAFTRMIKEQEDENLGKVLTIDEFRQEYIIKNEKINAEIEVLITPPPSTSTDVEYTIGEIISDGKGGFAKIINLDGIENGLNESHIEIVDENGNPLPTKLIKRSRAKASQERFRP